MMLTIEPVRDRGRLESLFDLAGLLVPPFPFAVELTFGGQQAFGLFEIDHEEAAIAVLFAKAEDTGILDAVIRAGISAGEQMGCVSFNLASRMPGDMTAKLIPLGYTSDPRPIEDFFGNCPGSCR